MVLGPRASSGDKRLETLISASLGEGLNKG
jgi:hypothetical protein